MKNKQKPLFSITPTPRKKEDAKAQGGFDLSRENTQEKLEVYKNYLHVYLEVLTHFAVRSKKQIRINICDMFAGRGEYDGQNGSAASAIEIIKEFQERIKGKNIDIFLYLNDETEKCYKSLGEVIKSTESGRWAFCSCKDANIAIKEIVENMRTEQQKLGHTTTIYSLFYLDPFGYKQLERYSIDTIMDGGKTHNECILFVPVTAIARFARKNLSISEQMPSIAKFLEEYEIDPKDTGWKTCGITIKRALAKIYRYVGSARLRASGANYYALYFIGNHIYGLDKFMESVDTVKKEGKTVQKPISEAFNFLRENNSSEIKSYLSESSDNCQLYEYVLMHGWSCASATKLLQELESNGEICVKPLTSKISRRTSFYLSYRDYFNKNRKIRVHTKNTSTSGEKP